MNRHLFYSQNSLVKSVNIFWKYEIDIYTNTGSGFLLSYCLFCNYTGCNQPIVTCVVTLIELLYTMNSVGGVTPTS